MEAAFAIIAALTLVSGVAAMSLRNLVHCALCLAVAFAGLAAMYLQLDAQFAGFAQVLVYIGAVAILVVFAILLTRSGQPPATPVASRSWIAGLVIAIVVFAVLAKAIHSSPAALRALPSKPEPTVREIGSQLMTRYVLPLQVMGLLLTAATIGAVIVAMREGERAGSVEPAVRGKSEVFVPPAIDETPSHDGAGEREAEAPARAKELIAK